MTVIYGIPNCDSCRKAVHWFKERGYSFRFHDLKADGPPEVSQLRSWCAHLGWETLLNRRSTTFRGLSPEEQNITNTEVALQLILRYPLLLKRPLVDTEKGCIAGFDPVRLTGLFPNA